jgi:hypothetical protein
LVCVCVSSRIEPGFMCKNKKTCQLEVKLNTVNKLKLPVIEMTGHMSPNIVLLWSCKPAVSISLRFSRPLLKFPFIAQGTSGAQEVNIKADLRYRLIIDVDVVFSCLLICRFLLYRQGPECISVWNSKPRSISSGFSPPLLRGPALHIIALM